MTDMHDKKTRSKNMSAIKGKNTQPELWVRKRLHALGYRYRLHYKSLPGKPDLVLKKYRAVIFIHGCFWHMHECSAFKFPSTRTEWWKTKLESNRERDQRQLKELHSLGWRVLIIWECAIKGRAKLGESKLLYIIETWLHSKISIKQIPDVL